MQENDTALSPKHYKDFNIEAIAICSQFSFCLGNAFKYIIRAGKKVSYTKDGKIVDTYKQDLEKALVYLKFYNELEIKSKIVRCDLKMLRRFKNVFITCDNAILNRFAGSFSSGFEYSFGTLQSIIKSELEVLENE